MRSNESCFIFLNDVLGEKGGKDERKKKKKSGKIE